MTTDSHTLEGIGQDSWIARRYRVGRELARGGMGSVYRVLDEQTGEARALKRLLPPAGPDVRAQFEREYRTLASIRHPRIIEVFDYGIDRGEPYYTMELLDGQDLREVAPLPFARACRHLRDIATSLALLHTRRLLHRDIKAGNVRLTADGHCKLLDFGALTPFGTPERIVGTAPYLPPEALGRAPLDQRADLYSFGALCYWLLTRRHAYRAREFAELPALWAARLLPPSYYQPDIPKRVDQLILSLLSPDPMARPNSMAEVVELLNRLGDLPPEDAQTQQALGESYLATTQFVGRQAEMEALGECLPELAAGQGGAWRLEGPAGVGRSRVLEELGTQAQLAGVATVQVDAAMHDRPRGTALAAIVQLVEKSPAARRQALALGDVLRGLDPHFTELLGAAAPPATGRTSLRQESPVQGREALFRVLTAACDEAPLLLLVDNADTADEASRALFVAALHLARTRPFALVLARHPVPAGAPDPAPMPQDVRRVVLEPLTAEATHALARSVFGECPNLTRFAEWLHRRSGGLPLHSVEIIRRLHADGVIRFRDGVWLLPAEQPEVAAPQRLEGLIDRQLDALSAPAHAFAEQVAIRRGTVVRSERVRVTGIEGDDPYAVIDELLRGHVLAETVDGYSFRNNALREAVARRMKPERRRQLHLDCAAQVRAEAPEGQLSHAARIEAGWHLLHAGEEGRGAELLAVVAYDTIGVRLSFADLQVVAPALEAALEVYTREGRSLYERAPLLAALAQAGYYEHRRWAAKYGDDAVAACREVVGLNTAVRMQRYLGKTLGLGVGLALGWLRFIRQPRRARVCSFRDLIVQLMGLVTTLVGVAACALDVKQARRVASVLDPFMHLPDRLTPVGIGQFCYSLCDIGRDDPAAAMVVWERLLRRFDDPRYYPTLPPEARPLYTGGLWFARGVFEAFRGEGGALRAADALDALGMKLYRMIASELRMLHHVNRGDLRAASEFSLQLELHAVEMGSASQVEQWEPAALILPYASMGEVVPLRRVLQQLRQQAAETPSLSHYAELAELALEHVSHARTGEGGDSAPAGAQSERMLASARRMVAEAEPRSYIGWGAVAGHLAHSLNSTGQYAESRDTCEGLLSVLDDGDLDFVAMFLGVELELAVAEAGLGEMRAAAARLDGLLQRHEGSDNPLTRGRIHDAYCRAAALGGQWDLYQHHLANCRAYYRTTTSPGLAARVELLASLRRRSSRPAAPGDVRDAAAGQEPTRDVPRPPAAAPASKKPTGPPPA